MFRACCANRFLFKVSMKTTIIVIIIAVIIGGFFVWKFRYLSPPSSVRLFLSSKTVQLNEVFVLQRIDQLRGWYWGSRQYPKKYTPASWKYNEKYQIWFNPNDFFHKLFLKQ